MDYHGSLLAAYSGLLLSSNRVANTLKMITEIVRFGSFSIVRSLLYRLNFQVLSFGIILRNYICDLINMVMQNGEDQYSTWSRHYYGIFNRINQN